MAVTYKKGAWVRMATAPGTPPAGWCWVYIVQDAGVCTITCKDEAGVEHTAGGGASGSASGDLGGTYPSPTVTQTRGLLETSGPTTLALGAIADGEYLRRSGSSIVGGSPAGGSGGATEVSVTLADDQPVTVTVTGLAWVTSSSKLVASPFGTAADGLTVEQYLLAELVWVLSNRVNGVGFDLTIRSLSGAPGTYRIHVIGA